MFSYAQGSKFLEKSEKGESAMEESQKSEIRRNKIIGDVVEALDGFVSGESNSSVEMTNYLTALVAFGLMSG